VTHSANSGQSRGLEEAAAQPMSEALEKIRDYAQDFSELVERFRCRSTIGTFKAADWEDAYNRLSRLRERYIREKSYLDPSERQALTKVFEEDTFIEGLLHIRQIGEHVQISGREPVVIRSLTNAPITICVETSALGFFHAPIVRVHDETTGQLHSISHLQNIEEAEENIQRALDRVTKKLL
jgi:hypothetical protein